jgi:hypothetical protein
LQREKEEIETVRRDEIFGPERNVTFERYMDLEEVKLDIILMAIN